METLPTGISVLDREFGGGLPSGSVVVLKADRRVSQSSSWIGSPAFAAVDT